ncbi:MAG: aspartate 1-decarboxylase [Candidatus Omnitrophica bacterium]|nr:aspartate 1-decarboxylase [Candidatus Omnitrophota bacterium]
MYREIARSKIHRVRITETQLYYEGSITIDKDLLEAADIVEGEKVDVLNLANGSRVQTYVIAAASGSGSVILNGPAAKSGKKGDEVIIITYYLIPNNEIGKIKTTPRVVYVDENNRKVRVKE